MAAAAAAVAAGVVAEAVVFLAVARETLGSEMVALALSGAE